MTYYPKFFLNKGRILPLWVIYIQPKENSLKFKLLAFWRKQTPFIDQKCTYKRYQTKNSGRALPPLIWTKCKRTERQKPSLIQTTTPNIFIFSIYSAIRINRTQHVFSSGYPIVYAHRQKRMCIVCSAQCMWLVQVETVWVKSCLARCFHLLYSSYSPVCCYLDICENKRMNLFF